MTTASDFLKYCRVSDRYRSCPAVSQHWRHIDVFSTDNNRVWKSTPTVAPTFASNLIGQWKQIRFLVYLVNNKFWILIEEEFHGRRRKNSYSFLQRREMIDVFPTLESPTNITLNAHVGIPCPFVSRSAIVFSRTIIKENTTILYLIVVYFSIKTIQKYWFKGHLLFRRLEDGPHSVALKKRSLCDFYHSIYSSSFQLH